MKKLFFLLFIIAGCQKENTSCYEFILTQVTYTSTYVHGFPQTVTSTTTSCGLTGEEAKQAAKDLTSTTTAISGGVTVTVKKTCIYRKK